MEKKIRNIYTVVLSEVTAWDEEDGCPTEYTGASYDLEFITTDPLKAFSVFCGYPNELRDDEELSVSACEIEVSDEEWQELLIKDKLGFRDYSDYDTGNERLLAWDLRHDDISETECDELFQEIFHVKSEYFNMRAICEKAGVNYSTFRGFKNNRQYFSEEKILKLLKCMHDVGNECWDEVLQEKYDSMLNRSERMTVEAFKQKFEAMKGRLSEEN